MTRRHVGAVLVLLVALVLLVPTATTVAPFTSRDNAASTTGGAGQWCAVPTPETQSNVYRLNDMTEVTFGGATSRMIIVPVVNNGEYGPAPQAGENYRLGVRLWACNSDSMTNNSRVKVTSWRRGSNSAPISWVSGSTTEFTDLRLNPEQGFGARLVELHRHGGEGDGLVRGQDRSRFTWLVASGRTKNAVDASPPAVGIAALMSIPRQPSPKHFNTIRVKPVSPIMRWTTLATVTGMGPGTSTETK